MKRCFKCAETKPLTEFYRHAMMGDGLLGKCKECTKADTRANRDAKIDYYRMYDRKRASMPHRKALGIRVHAAWKAKHPKRRKAQIMLGNAVRTGRVVPWPVCAVPECSERPEAHHPNYDAPLDVVWLCPVHHKQTHALARQLMKAA